MSQLRASYLLVVLSLIGLPVWAGVPQLINFQGQLKNNSGSPLVNDTLAVEFKIYDDASSGNVKWSEVDTVITDANGLFTILLGKKTPIADSVFNDSLRWLGIKVGSDPEISPRSQLSSVGYSYVSSQWTSAGQDLFRLNGNVGIGTAFPGFQTKLDVQNSGSNSFLPIRGIAGSAANTSSGAAQGGYFSTESGGTGSHYGVFGDAYGSSSGAVYGVYGQATSSSFDDTYGGYFSSSSSGGNSRGIWASGGLEGVFATGNYGVYASGIADGIIATGEVGVYGGGGTYGVYGSGNSYGVYGSGGDYGVYGNSSSNIGVYGTSGTYDGGYFTGGNAGVVGSGITYGVFGQANNNGGYGVFGSDGFNPLVYAGYFQGDVRVSGDFDVVFGTKSAAVKTDNGEYRRLYSQESPENWFEDFGTAQLVNGQAVVNIDPTFVQTVNTTVTYHVFLTPEGDCRGLYVTSKTPASFEIRELQSGKSDLSVSYRIVAKRKGYENIRLAKLTGKTPEEVRAEQIKMEAEHKQQEEQQAKLEAERQKLEEQRIEMEQQHSLPKQ